MMIFGIVRMIIKTILNSQVIFLYLMRKLFQKCEISSKMSQFYTLFMVPTTSQQLVPLLGFFMHTTVNDLLFMMENLVVLFALPQICSVVQHRFSSASTKKINKKRTLKII